MENFFKSQDPGLDLPTGEDETVREQIQKKRDAKAAEFRAVRSMRDALRTDETFDDAAREQDERTIADWQQKLKQSLPEAKEEWEDNAVYAAIDELYAVQQALWEDIKKLPEQSLGRAEADAVLNPEFFALIQTALLSKVITLREAAFDCLDDLATDILSRQESLLPYFRERLMLALEKLLDEDPGVFRDNPDILSALLTCMVMDGPFALPEREQDIIERSLAGFSDEQFVSLDGTALEFLLGANRPEALAYVSRAIAKGIQERRFDSALLHVCRFPSPAYVELLQAVTADLTNRFGVKWDPELVRSWSDTDDRRYRYWKLNENLSRLDALERVRSGTVQLLVERYGIYEFHRYPLEMLRQQAEKHDEDVPYGVIVYPRADHNDAFDRPTLLRNVFFSTQGRHVTRIFEAGSNQDLVTILNRLRRYRCKPEYLLLGAHGQAEQMFFGGNEIASLTMTDLERLDLTPRIRTLFEGGMSVVLKSCSTGAPGGFAERFSQKLGVHVQAPIETTSVKSVVVAYDAQGKPRLKVEFEKEDTHAMYSDGKRTTP